MQRDTAGCGHARSTARGGGAGTGTPARAAGRGNVTTDPPRRQERTVSSPLQTRAPQFRAGRRGMHSGTRGRERRRPRQCTHGTRGRARRRLRQSSQRRHERAGSRTATARALQFRVVRRGVHPGTRGRARRRLRQSSPRRHERAGSKTTTSTSTTVSCSAPRRALWHTRQGAAAATTIFAAPTRTCGVKDHYKHVHYSFV